MLDDDVNDETAKWVIAKMLFLEYQDPVAPIYLWVESDGGNVLAGLAIIDTLKKIRPPVHTVCRRRAHSIAAVIVASGRKGRRQAYKDARLSITPLTWPDPQPGDERERRRLLQDLIAIVAEQTGQPMQTVRHDFETGREFDARGARDYGLIDSVAD
jgi:ATP-dependent Clp protease, protease subunit